MLTLSCTTGDDLSFEEKILAMSDDMIVHQIPDQLRESGLFSEDEIQHVAIWLQEYRNHHHLDVIE